jgi:hypothetical protein
MEAVARKIEGRRAMMKRKPGMAVMIAIGGPKKPMMDDEGDDEMERPMPKMGKAEKIAALQEKIAALKAELALLEDEDEMDEPEMDDEAEDED